MKSIIVVLMTLFAVQSWGATELRTVEYVDLSRFAGTWFQIARKPVIFETGCVCSRQVLTPMETGEVAVYNSCNLFSPEGPLADIEGTARVVDSDSNAKLKVNLGLPWEGDYWVIGLADDYSWAVVSDPKERSLYVLSRTTEMSDEDYSNAIDSVSDQTDVSVLRGTPQMGCEYPEL